MPRRKHRRQPIIAITGATLLLVALLTLSLLVLFVHRTYQEQQAIAGLYESDGLWATAGSRQWAPTWLGKCVPSRYHDLLLTTEELQVSSPDMKAVDLSILKKLPNLERLVLSDAKVTQANIEHIRSMRHLEVLRLIRPTISEEQLDRLRLDEPRLTIEVEDAWDLAGEQYDWPVR